MMCSSFSVDSMPDLTGRVYIVTGGNAGIGYETVYGLASKGAAVYLCARSESKATTAITSLQEKLQNPSAPIHYLHMDNMNLSTIVAATNTFLSKESSLHGLILNAGIMCTPWEESTDGYESHWQTNYLSHYLLSYLLLPTIQSTALNCEPGVVRIVELTSAAWQMAKGPGIWFDQIALPNHEPYDRYCQSKLANVLHIRELQKKVGPKAGNPVKGEIWVASVHPGLVETGLSANFATTSVLGRTLLRMGMGAPPDKGALGSLFAAASNDFKRDWSGSYMVPTAKKGWTWRWANDKDLQEKLWKWTEDQMRWKGFLSSSVRL
ncbi:hypothetical protein EYR41_006600 [Orbilia oligospora]|uniref:Uncharacterized protein n=1 Tax=Orbilia oligospora TaxID=2813651 RepID=A0A7C8NRQ0_ORBOL|nr:hypothetical protein TWF751_004883 [Orbilia oligospora]TGJ67469.1 hypothetical protein EYR41_006600 [Orbilia oligospora]